MALDPQSIEHIQFTVVRVKGGYDQQEVDDFLDRVYAAWSEDQQRLSTGLDEIARLRRKVSELEALCARLRESEAPTMVLPSASAERLLELAQKAHDEQIAEAGQEAARLLEEARTEAARQAEEERTRIIGEARRVADNITSDAHAEKAALVAKINRAREALQ